MTEISDTIIEEIEEQQPPSRGRSVVLVTGIVLLVALFGVFTWSLQTRESTQLIGAPSPPFELTTFEGEQISLADYQGQVVVVNFWASWCVECYREAALLETAYQDFKDRDVVFIGVDYLDTEKEALEYMTRYGITYPSGPDIGSKIYRKFQLTGVPETIFIDRNGNVHHVQIGSIEQPQLYRILEDLVSAEQS